MKQTNQREYANESEEKKIEQSHNVALESRAAHNSLYGQKMCWWQNKKKIMVTATALAEKKRKKRANHHRIWLECKGEIL